MNAEPRPASTAPAPRRAPLIYIPPTAALLDSYSSWLFLERHYLLVARFGVEKAIGMIDTVRVDNPGAVFHMPAGADLPDYGAPVRRAATMLTAAGCDWRIGRRL